MPYTRLALARFFITLARLAVPLGEVRIDTNLYVADKLVQYRQRELEGGQRG